MAVHPRTRQLMALKDQLKRRKEEKRWGVLSGGEGRKGYRGHQLEGAVTTQKWESGRILFASGDLCFEDANSRNAE